MGDVTSIFEMHTFYSEQEFNALYAQNQLRSSDKNSLNTLSGSMQLSIWTYIFIYK